MNRRARALYLIGVVLVAAAAGIVLLATDAFRGVERDSVNTRFDVRGAQEPRDDIVLVGIDDATLNEVGTFPFNRRRHARVIRQLEKAGADVIAYAVQFTQPSKDAGADEALINAVRAGNGRVVLATTAVEPGAKTQIFGGGQVLKYSRAVPGYSAFQNDEDGVTRHVPPANVDGLDNFTLVAAGLKLGHPVVQPPRDSTWIDFKGPAGTVPALSFADVERGTFDPQAVRGKIVVVGATARALQDFRATSTTEKMSGSEAQAAAIATALDGFPLRDAPGWLDVLLIVVLALVGPLVAWRFGAAFGALAQLVGVALYVGGAQLAFNAGTVVTIVPPLAAAAVGFIGVLAMTVAEPHPFLNRVLDRLSPSVGNRRTRRLRTVLLLGAGFLCALGSLGLMATHALRRLDLNSVDMRFDVRGKQATPDSVAVVAIDDPSINAAGNVFPFTRKLHAKVIRNLTKAGAAVIAYDVQFTQPSGNDAADNALITAVRAGAPRVVMASTAVDDGKTQIFGGGEGLKYSRAVPSESNFQPDSDGVTRRMSLEADGLATFAIAAARIKLGHPVRAPGPEDQWIDYVGPPRTIPYISFIDVARNRFDPADVKGKVVVVGATASALQDLRTTSTTGSVPMPGPEVHANAVLTALEGFPLQSDAGWVNVLLVVLCGVAAPFAAVRWRMLIAVPLGIIVIAGLIVGAQIAFQNDVIIGVVYALVAGVAALLLTGAIHGVTVAFERANTRDAFARFVPESVVDQVLQDAEGVRLGGVRGEATVMFSDLRGFTSFAETLQPEQVIDALNRYLTAMSEAILDHGGTLVAYMGDGIMAVFGAPLQQEDHADRALAAARDMLAKLEGFNGWLREQEMHQGFKMGIGLNTGPVMSGNVGSERRLEYTALGDTTNTAARLEGMTKGTPYQLYLADSTREALLTPAADLAEVGEFEVRGRKAKIKLWSLADDQPPADEPQSNGVDPAVAAKADADPAGHDRDAGTAGEREADPSGVTGADGPDRDVPDPHATT